MSKRATVIHLQTNSKEKSNISRNTSDPQVSRQSSAVTRIQNYLNKFDPKEFLLTVVDANKSRIKIQLDISDDNPDGENFYLELDLTKRVTHVIQTNIPLLLPIQKLAEKYSRISEVKKFAEEVSLLLKAYTNRKKQVSLLQEKFKVHLINGIDTTHICDYVEFSVKLTAESGVLTTGLSYSLYDIHPSEITYRWRGCVELQPSVINRMKNNQDVFKNEDLAEAFCKLFL